MNLEELKALCEEATPGPWEAYDANEGTDRAYSPMWCVANEEFHNPSGDDDAPWLAVDVHVGDKADADFIAAARTVLPKLIAAVEGVREITAGDLPPSGFDTYSEGFADGQDILGQKIDEAINNALGES